MSKLSWQRCQCERNALRILFHVWLPCEGYSDTFIQQCTLILNIGDTHYLHVKVRQAEDYPVDLYYLMDLSKSMEDDLQVLKYLADVVGKSLNLSQVFNEILIVSIHSIVHGCSPTNIMWSSPVHCSVKCKWVRVSLLFFCKASL